MEMKYLYLKLSDGLRSKASSILEKVKVLFSCIITIARTHENTGKWESCKILWCNIPFITLVTKL